MPSNPNQPCSNELWYLIHCHARQELYTANVLRSHLGLQSYFPVYTVYAQSEIRTLPLFPGYIFVRADFQKVSPSQINASPGVFYLVAFGADPQSVPDSVIEEIARRSEQRDGPNPQPFHHGDSVRVRHSGPLQDLEMIFVGPTTAKHRVNVLLSFLGRLKEVSVDPARLEKVSSYTSCGPVAPLTDRQPKRYTRGKGRKIKYSA